MIIAYHSASTLLIVSGLLLLKKTTKRSLPASFSSIVSFPFLSHRRKLLKSGVVKLFLIFQELIEFCLHFICEEVC